MDAAWLKKNNFQLAGEFVPKSSNKSGIGVDFHNTSYVNEHTNWIYAITLNGQIKYIGETAQTLSQRIRLYYLQSRVDSTNSNMRNRLKKLLSSGQVVQIYAQKAPAIMYNSRNITLRVDLEISFINELNPSWNKKGIKKSVN